MVPSLQLLGRSCCCCISHQLRAGIVNLQGMSQELKLSTALTIVRSQKRNLHNSAFLSTPPMKQQWRPKVKAQCATSIETTTDDAASPSKTWDQLKAVVQNLADESPVQKVEKVSTSLKVDDRVIEVINRKRKKLKKKIEGDTQTSLSISRVKGGSVIDITGSSKENVDSAAAKLQLLMQTDEGANAGRKNVSVQPSKTIASATLQWLPKAGLHTAVGTVEASNEELISGCIEVDKKLLRLVKGKKNEVKERIEEQTNTTLLIGCPIVVRGSSEESVQNALEEIRKVIEEAVNDTKFQYSHFISLPLCVHPELVKALEEFHVSILTSLGIPLTDEHATMVDAGKEDVNDEEVEEADSPDEKTVETSAVTTRDQRVLDVIFKQSVASSLDIQAGDDDVEVSKIIEQEDEIEETETAEKFEGKAKDQEIVQVEAPTEPLPYFLRDAQELQEPKYEPIQEVPMAVKNESKTGIERSIFIKPSRFHLTVLMLKLWNEERVKQASEVLQKCLPDVAAALEGKPVSVSLQGLEIMRGSPKSTRVLYAKVAEAGEGNRLLNACQVLINAFIDSGLVLAKDREQGLKLHATVMNTSHRRSKSKFRNKGFDATGIIERYGDTNWGEYQITEAHLSERFKYDEGGYYHCCSSIPFTGTADS